MLACFFIRQMTSNEDIYPRGDAISPFHSGYLWKNTGTFLSDVAK